MTHKDFIALAEFVISLNGADYAFTQRQVLALANFCHLQNPKFDKEKWFRYIVNGKSQNLGCVPDTE